MRSTFGKNIKVSIWGGSHEPEIGCDIEGLPVGTVVDMNYVRAFLARRAPGKSPFTTKRKENDDPVPVSGLSLLDSDGNTLEISGDVISFKIVNADMRSGDYKKLRSVPRPAHADYTARLRYGETLNMAGGGPFSARMTAPLCIAGAIVMQILERKGMTIGSHIVSIGEVNEEPLFDVVKPDKEMLDALKQKDLPVISAEAEEKMLDVVRSAMKDEDSVGGVIEVCALNVPAGIGGAMYDGVESILAPVYFGIPAVKGIEFGAGFSAASKRGSENNDAFFYDGEVVKTKTNNHGGILGGITTGMPLIARIAFKPTPSIGREQDSVDLDEKKNVKLKITGRHDPCVVLRAAPIVEAATAIGILDCLMEEK